MTELTNRQEKILKAVVEEYIKTAESVSSEALAKKREFNVCSATIRNDLQALTKGGFIEQPHTSAGRVPTKKAYRHFANKMTSQRGTVFSEFIFQEIKITRGQIDEELKLAEDLIKSLSETSSILSISRTAKKDDLFEILSIMGPARVIYQKNITIINKIIEELEKF